MRRRSDVAVTSRVTRVVSLSSVEKLSFNYQIVSVLLVFAGCTIGFRGLQSLRFQDKYDCQFLFNPNVKVIAYIHKGTD